MHFFRNKYPMNKSVPVDPVLGQISQKWGQVVDTPSEKQDNIIGCPAAVVSFRKVFYGIVYVLECLKNWRQCQWKIDGAKGL